jgi:hypothetical protein
MGDYLKQKAELENSGGRYAQSEASEKYRKHPHCPEKGHRTEMGQRAENHRPQSGDLKCHKLLLLQQFGDIAR